MAALSNISVSTAKIVANVRPGPRALFFLPLRRFKGLAFKGTFAGTARAIGCHRVCTQLSLLPMGGGWEGASFDSGAISVA